MTNQAKNKVRCVFLLVVFSLNIIAGFACSVGMDMGYNSNHHIKQDSSHFHDNSHQSHGKTDCHVPVKHSESQGPSDDCCSDEVTRFIKLDKSLETGFQLQAPAITASYLSGFIIPIFSDDNSSRSIISLTRRSWPSSYHTAIRIVIQSFQI
jgi:hypothetical protein